MIGTAAGVLAASLVGSVHCAAMCGGFVCFYTGSEPTGGAGRAADRSTAEVLHSHALYNVGRLLAYLTLGAIAGLIGSKVSDIGAVAGIQQAATIAAGLLMIMWALSTLAVQRGVSFGAAARTPEAWRRLLGQVLFAVRSQPTPVRALLTGLLTTLLPCGWLYVFVAAAGGTGSVPSAMTMMAVFWLGTVPALLAIGLGAQTVLGSFRNRLPMVSAVVVLVMGLWSVANHLRVHRHGDVSVSAVEATRATSGPPASEQSHAH